MGRADVPVEEIAAGRRIGVGPDEKAFTPNGAHP